MSFERIFRDDNGQLHGVGKYEVPMRKIGEGEYVADISGLSCEDKQRLIEAIQEKPDAEMEIEAMGRDGRNEGVS